MGENFFPVGPFETAGGAGLFLWAIVCKEYAVYNEKVLSLLLSVVLMPAVGIPLQWSPRTDVRRCWGRFFFL